MFTRTRNTLLTTAALVVCLNLVSLTPLRAQCTVDVNSIGTGAMVLVQSGDVSQLGDRVGYRTVLSACGVVKQGQTIKTGSDGYAKFQVRDGSTFEVFQNTEVVFRKTFSPADLLNVWMGKIKVYIQHLPGIPNPNNVTTPTALISVRGTIFDVEVQDAEGTTFVAVDEGQVDVRHLGVASAIVSLHPGQSIQVIRNMPLVPLARDKGFIFKKMLEAAQDAARVIAQRPTGGGPGGTGVPVGSTGGNQGDQGKNTGGTTTGTGTGTGAPTGAPPAPPPPPPPGGGGGGDE